MQNVKFCELSDFGSALCDKRVRDRAIKNRVEAIKYSHMQRQKFETQFREAKKQRKESTMAELQCHEDYVKVNAQETTNFNELQKSRKDEKKERYQEAYEKAKHNRILNQYRKEVRALVFHNRNEIKQA